MPHPDGVAPLRGAAEPGGVCSCRTTGVCLFVCLFAALCPGAHLCLHNSAFAGIAFQLGALCSGKQQQRVRFCVAQKPLRTSWSAAELLLTNTPPAATRCPVPAQLRPIAGLLLYGTQLTAVCPPTITHIAVPLGCTLIIHLLLITSGLQVVGAGAVLGVPHVPPPLLPAHGL